VDVNQVYFEFKLSREEAVSFDYSELAMYHFEVYGIEDYYNDFYLEDEVDSITTNIENSDEQEVGVSILIVKENLSNTIKEILEYLKMRDMV
jgi:vacuolar-type H+-ATPase subunit F/Vma7